MTTLFLQVTFNMHLSIFYNIPPISSVYVQQTLHYDTAAKNAASLNQRTERKKI